MRCWPLGSRHSKATEEWYSTVPLGLNDIHPGHHSWAGFESHYQSWQLLIMALIAREPLRVLKDEIASEQSSSFFKCHLVAVELVLLSCHLHAWMKGQHFKIVYLVFKANFFIFLFHNMPENLSLSVATLFLIQHSNIFKSTTDRFFHSLIVEHFWIYFYWLKTILYNSCRL